MERDHTMLLNRYSAVTHGDTDNSRAPAPSLCAPRRSRLRAGIARSRVLPAALLGLALVLLTGAGLMPARAAPAIKPLSTAVIKSTTGLCLRGKICHVNKAGVWIPDRDVAIVSASIAEQVDVALYVDIEISTKPEMYQCNEADASGCIFRMKYSGPGLYVYGATSGNTYLGSNVTTTSITFPAGYGIVVKKGVPVYVHLDVRNGSLIDLKVDQDAWLYYVPLDQHE
jgi:hypothetical protein